MRFNLLLWCLSIFRFGETKPAIGALPTATRDSRFRAIKEFGGVHVATPRSSKAGITGTYNRAQYRNEKVDALNL